ncbi:hypothetical protein ACFOEK_14060 [Litoribrevibacter euphylliae]|uniref:Uncharacterized protein n=1 Tax=Litoribrevibacter euphylliae TaxID=1834034 RepID=A0ABV7HE57_9GAMM
MTEKVTCTSDADGSLHPVTELSQLSLPPQNLVNQVNLELLEQALESFVDAEEHIKHAELNTSEVVIPSINELRYFGYHITKALKTNDEATQAEELKKAIKHCKRASYDAVELGIISALENIQSFQESFRGKISISSTISDYAGKMQQVEDVKKAISSTPKDDRDDYYKYCQENLKEIQDIYNYISQYEDDLTLALEESLTNKDRLNKAEERAEKAEERAEKSEQRLNRNFKISLFGAFVSVISVTLLAYKLFIAPPQTKSSVSKEDLQVSQLKHPPPTSNLNTHTPENK